MSKLSLLQRLAAETPAAEKRIQVISLVLSVMVSYLFKLDFLPQNVLWMTSGLLAGISLLAQYTVKDTGYVKNALTDPYSLLAALPDIMNQVVKIKTALSSKTQPDIAAMLEQLIQLMGGVAVKSPGTISDRIGSSSKPCKKANSVPPYKRKNKPNNNLTT